MKIKLTRETIHRLDTAGLHVSSCWQLPQPDGRKLKNVAQDGDPWIAQIFYPETEPPVSWHASFVAWGAGATADEAVRVALTKAEGFEGRLLKLAGAMEHLTGAMNEHRAVAFAA